MLRLKCYERVSIENWRFRSNGVTLPQKFQVEGVGQRSITSLPIKIQRIYCQNLNHRPTWFLERVGDSVDLAIANSGSVCLSVRRSVRHIHDPRLKVQDIETHFAPRYRAVFLVS